MDQVAAAGDQYSFISQWGKLPADLKMKGWRLRFVDA